MKTRRIQSTQLASCTDSRKDVLACQRIPALAPLTWVMAIAALAAGPWNSAAAASPTIYCTNMYQPYADQPRRYQRHSVTNPLWYTPQAGRTQWLTLGTEIAHYKGTNRIFCAHNNGDARPDVYLQTLPSQQYLEWLRRNGVDARLRAITPDGSTEDIMLLRDSVSPTAGRAVRLGSYKAVPWANATTTSTYYIPQGIEPSQAVPSVTVELTYLFVDPSKQPANSRIRLDLPKSDGLSIRIGGPDNSPTGLALAHDIEPRSFSFGTCAAPTITINHTGSAQADVNFGTVPFDILRQRAEFIRPQEFSIQFKTPVETLSECKGASYASKRPHLRFVAAHRFENGMFEGDLNDNAYPGNRSVAVELTGASGRILGANRGDISTNTFVPVSTGDLSSVFSATLKPRANVTPSAGPFLIPVTVEAFYH